MNNTFDQTLKFCKFRIPQSSGKVIWEITNECNYGCKYCIFSSTGKIPEGELATEQVFDVLAQLQNEGFTHIKFTGGEPFLRSDMMEILEKAIAIGMTCDISTNASKIDSLCAQRISRLHLSMVHVSVDGHTREIHEAVRGKKSWEPTLTGLQYLTNHGNKVRIGSVLHLYNQDSIKDMVRWCESQGAHEVIFSLMENVGRLRGKTTGLATKTSSNFMDEIERLESSIKVSHNFNSSSSPSNSICPGGTRFLFINSVGIVSPCTWISEKKPQYIGGSLHHNSLNNILVSQPILDFRQSLTIGSCPAEVI